MVTIKSAYAWGKQLVTIKRTYAWGQQAVTIKSTYAWGQQLVTIKSTYAWGQQLVTIKSTYAWGQQAVTMKLRSYTWLTKAFNRADITPTFLSACQCAQYQTQYCSLASSQASSVFSSHKSSVQTKRVYQHWWNDTDAPNRSAVRQPFFFFFFFFCLGPVCLRSGFKHRCSFCLV